MCVWKTLDFSENIANFMNELGFASLHRRQDLTEK